MSSHTWGDCCNNPKNKTSEGQHNNNNNDPNKDSHYRHRNYSFPRGQGHGHGYRHGRGSYNIPCLPNLFLTLYIQQAPTNVPLDALSTVTNTDTSTIAPPQTYMVKPMNNNRGENNSRWLYNNVVYCESVNIDNIHCCDTAADAKNVTNLALPCANPQSHHFNSFLYPYPQDGVISGHQPNKNNMFYAFDTECIQEVDNFQIYIDIFTNQTECLNTIQQDLLPISLLIPKYIQNVPNHKVLIALFDSGGTITLIHERVLMTGVTPFISTNQIFTTLAGEFQSNRQVLLQDIVLPEFKGTAYIQSHACQVFIGPCSYDIILGRDFLRKIHFHINFDNNTMNCMDVSVPMRAPDFFTDRTRLRNIIFFDNVEVDSFASTITKSTYHPISISSIVDTQTHLSVEDRKILSNMLNKHTVLFDGILKVYPHQLVHLDILPNVTPRHLRAYPVANIHLNVFKAELSPLCDIGVLE